MITGCLQQKNGYYYVLLYLKVDGKRKVKWISTKLPVSGTSERKAKRAFDEIRSQFEKNISSFIISHINICFYRMHFIQ